MKYVEVLICVLLMSLFVGILYGKESHSMAPKPVEVETTPAIEDIQPEIENGLKPCSRTTMMPCEVSPVDPVRRKLENKYPVRKNLFYEGEKVTCVYPGVYWWDNGDEFMKTVGMECKVIKASEEQAYLAPGYQQIKVDCTKGLEKMWSTQPGAGMEKGHKLNFVKRWFSSDDCYHFSS